MRPELEAAALGALQGVTELLPVSSSAHVAALPWLLGWEPRDKAFEVALHTGAAVALAPELWRLRPDVVTLALSLIPPYVVGYACERHIGERRKGPLPLSVGLLGGAVALAFADRGPARRERVRAADGALLGLAQAAALAPGVSRTGATLAAARARGFSRPAASRLSFGVAGPVLAGATALKAWRTRGRFGRDAVVGGVAAFAATRAAVSLVGAERTAPLWPYAAERTALAGAILAVRYRRGR